MKTPMKIIVLALAASTVLLLAGCDQILESMFQMEHNTIEITAQIPIPYYQPVGWWDNKVWFRLRLDGGLISSGDSAYMEGNSYGSWAISSMKYEGVADGNYTIEVWLDQDGDGALTSGDWYSNTFYDPNTGYTMTNINMPYPNSMGGDEGRYVNLRADLLVIY